MSPIVRNIVSVVAGIAAGIAAMTILFALGILLMPLPEGVSITSPEELNAFRQSADVKWFLSPMIAHAVGTLVGAFVCSKIARGHWYLLAMSVAVFFLLGGIMQVFEHYHPTLIAIVDIALYLPMGWLGWKLAGGKR